MTPTAPIWMGLGNRPRHLTRNQYRALCLTWAGEAWDALYAQGSDSARTQAWRERTDAEATEERDRDMAAAHRRYLATPEWTALDAVTPDHRDPRKTLALRQAVRAEQEAAEARRQAKRTAA